MTWASGAASFDGTSGAITTGGPVLTTTASYSISAWVNLASTSQEYQTIVGQSAADGGNLYLEYSPTFGGWSFILRKADNTASGLAAYDYASSTTGVAANTWTHLVAVYSSSTGAMQLYVNGALAASATDTTPWQASGLTSIGAVANASGSVNYTNGQIANVQVYQRALSGGDVSSLYAGGRSSGALSSPSNTTTWALDGRDLPVSMTDANGQTTNYVYDEAGHRAITQEPTVTIGTYTPSGGYTTGSVVPTITSGYDTFGEVAESKDPTGLETTTTFDADGRPTSSTLPDYQQPGSTYNSLLSGQKSKTQYNELGQKTATWDPAGVQSTYVYDQLGHQSSETLDPGGLNRTVSTAYDLDGDTAQITDPAGNIQAATYDYLGRTLTSTQVLGLGGSGSTTIPAGCQQYNNVATEASCTTSYAYTDTAGFLSKTTTPSGVITQYGYDAAGERTSVTDGANQITSTGYDYAGRAIKTTLPDGTYSTTTYDQAGQVTAQAQYDAANTLLRSAGATYDADGNVLSSTDPDGNTTHFTYDAAGRLTGQSQPASYNSTLSQVPSVTQTITTSFGYDASGRPTRYVTGNGNPWYTTYNSRGLAETSVAPATTAYNTAATSTTTTTYDADGRPIEQDSPGAVTQTRTYDTAGEVLTQSGGSTNAVDAATATRTFTYYPSGLIHTAATSNTATSGSNATSESFAYDDSGALASTSGTAGTSTFAYTADGQMASRADSVAGTPYTTSYGYDGAGRLSSISEPLTGQTLTYAYTPNSLDYAVTYGTSGDVRSFHYNTAHELASDTLKTTGGAAVASIAYGYDANGNETSKTTTGFASAAANTYTYDQANRLKSWSNGTTVTGYAYDQDSNRTNVAGNTFTYDARDQLTSDGTNTYAYTARGTLQSTSSASGTVTTSSDAYNQQAAAGTTSYTYDALGRVTTVGAAAMTYSGPGNQIASDTNGALYTRDPSGAIIGVKVSPTSPGTIAYTDQHTDLVARFHSTDSTLSITTTYDPLGNVLATAGNQVALGYQSEYTNGGKVNMAARWYNPATGQFTSKDTASNNPVPNSANANPFAYGNDNPLTNTDPSGHRACGADGQCFGTDTADHGAANEARAYDDYQAAQARTPSHQIISQYASNEFDRCGARMGCFNSRLKALQSIKVGKDGHTLTGDPAAVADLNSVIKDLFPSSDQGNSDQHKQCNWNPMTWGGCAHNAEVWVAKHPLIKDILSVAIGVATGLLCTAATAVETGGGSVAGCVMLGAAAASGFGYAVTGDATGKGSVTGLLTNMTVSALAAGASFVTGDAASGAIATAARSVFGEGLAADAVSGAVTGGVSNGVGGALLGAGDYAAACESEGGCSWTGMLKAGLGSAATGAVSGAVFSGAAAAAGRSTSTVGCSSPLSFTGNLPHSFTGNTPVLMADGTTKPIDQIKAGDEVNNAEPNGASETHTVDKVIVTTTDHDFAALTITPVKPSISSVSAGRVSITRNAPTSRASGSFAGVALAAALIFSHGAPSGHLMSGHAGNLAAAANLTTTYHHEFYDVTTNEWTQAENLRPGDLLQTPTGYALLDAIQLYHANTVTYDLTIGDLHTYYVVAGSTPVLVHNCDGIDPSTGGLNDATYDRIDEAHGPKVAQGVDYQVQRMHDGSATSLDHVIPGIGHNPDALGDYFARWEGNMTHTDLNTGARVAYDDSTGSIIVENAYMVHGYQLSQDVFDSATFTDANGVTRQRYVLQ